MELSQIKLKSDSNVQTKDGKDRIRVTPMEVLVGLMIASIIAVMLFTTSLENKTIAREQKLISTLSSTTLHSYSLGLFSQGDATNEAEIIYHNDASTSAPNISGNILNTMKGQIDTSRGSYNAFFFVDKSWPHKIVAVEYIIADSGLSKCIYGLVYPGSISGGAYHGMTSANGGSCLVAPVTQSKVVTWINGIG